MFRRNLDFIAIAIVIFGFLAIEDVSRAGAEMLAARSGKTVAVQRCELGRVVARLALFRSE